ncbi:MAG: response regulator [Dehalococcoidia bacterium]|nr:response regulator [Dehalococcoidia bacterium]
MAMADRALPAKTVLVVDDEDTVRLVTARALEHMGFSVLTATDGLTGVQLFERHADDVACILLDMTMPHLSGEEAFARIVQIRSEARVVLMTGHSEADAREAFQGRGLAGFVQKPFDLQTLQSAVFAAIDR